MAFITSKPPPPPKLTPNSDIWLVPNYPDTVVLKTKDGWEIRRYGVYVCTAQTKDGARGLAELVAKGVCR